MDAGGPMPLRPAGQGRPFTSRSGGAATGGRGVAGTAAAILALAVGAAVFVVALVVIALLFVVVIAAALFVVAVRGLVHALSPHAGERPVEPGGFRPASVIESTATVIRRAAPRSRV